MTGMARRRRRDDDGASLILVMMFVIGVGLVVGSLLAYTSVGITSATKTLAANQSSADVAGALQLAVNDVRQSGYFNDPTYNAKCFESGAHDGAGTSKMYPAPSGGVVQVKCSPDPAGGSSGSLVESTTTVQSQQALLTLATAQTGIVDSGNNPLRINGSVYSNSGISVPTGSNCPEAWPPPSATTNCNGFYVGGATSTITAEGSCAGTVYPQAGVAVARSCNATSQTVGTDPGLVHPAEFQAPTAPTAAPSPAAPTSCSGSVVHFYPGLYTSATALNNITASNSCKNKVFWFHQGVYAFDFQDSPASKRVWKLAVPSTLVAGAATTPSSAVPGQCVAPQTGGSTSGAQFIFQGTSQLEISDGGFEICAPYSASTVPLKVPIAFFGGGGAPGPVVSVTSTAAVNPTVFVQGWTYMPAASVSVNLKKATNTVFKYPVVVSTIDLKISPNSATSLPVIDLGTPATRLVVAPTTVFLTAWSCASPTDAPTTATCSVLGRAKVRYTDNCLTPCPAGQRSVSVLGWKLER